MKEQERISSKRKGALENLGCPGKEVLLQMEIEASMNGRQQSKKKTSNSLPPPPSPSLPQSVTGHSSSDLIRFKSSQHLSKVIGHFFSPGKLRILRYEISTP